MTPRLRASFWCRRLPLVCILKNRCPVTFYLCRSGTPSTSTSGQPCRTSSVWWLCALNVRSSYRFGAAGFLTKKPQPGATTSKVRMLLCSHACPASHSRRLDKAAFIQVTVSAGGFAARWELTPRLLSGPLAHTVSGVQLVDKPALIEFLNEPRVNQTLRLEPCHCGIAQFHQALHVAQAFQ